MTCLLSIFDRRKILAFKILDEGLPVLTDDEFASTFDLPGSSCRQKAAIWPREHDQGSGSFLVNVEVDEDTRAIGGRYDIARAYDLGIKRKI